MLEKYQSEQAVSDQISQGYLYFLIQKKVKMVIVACNTASSLSLHALKRVYKIPIIGVISPGVEEAIRITKNNRVGVIGTNSTISSGSYSKELFKKNKSCKLFQQGCPLFVPLVENRFIYNSIASQIAEVYLSGLKKKNIDTLILGCTHYPILKSVIQRVMGDIKLVDSPFAVTKEVKKLLVSKNLLTEKRNRLGTMKCFVSDDVDGFRKTAKIFLKEDIAVKKVVLE